MKNKYIFKKAAVRDLEKLFGFFEQSIQKQFTEYSQKTRRFFIEREYSLPAIKAQVKAEEITTYLAFSDGEIVGYLMVRGIVGGVALANWIAVSKEHQKQGIASKLLALWEKDSKKAGMHKLHLWTDKRNIKFYQNRGFKLLGKVPDNYYGHDDYFFHKTLQKPLERNYLK